MGRVIDGKIGFYPGTAWFPEHTIAQKNPLKSLVIAP